MRWSPYRGQQYCSEFGGVVCIQMSLVCSASWVKGSDYNLVPTPKTVRGSNPGSGDIFRTCPDRFWGPLSLVYNGYQVFPSCKELPGHDANLSPLLVPWSRKSTATPLLRYRGPYGLYGASVPVQGCTLRYFFTLPQSGTGTAVAQWLRCCATNRKVAASIPADVIGICHWHKFVPITLWPGGRLSL